MMSNTWVRWLHHLDGIKPNEKSVGTREPKKALFVPSLRKFIFSKGQIRELQLIECALRLFGFVSD
jgi:hypothetical protein